MTLLNPVGVLADEDRIIHEAITQHLATLAQSRTARDLEQLMLRQASIRGRFTYLEWATTEAWKQALLDEGMAPERVEALIQQVRYGVEAK